MKEASTYGVRTLLDSIGWNKLDPLKPIADFGPSFGPSIDEPKKYLQPNLSLQAVMPGSHPKIVLISAAGAVGKSALTKYISATLNVPVLDLAKNKPVGDSTLTGILAHIYDFSEVKSALENGKQGVIIDALDEGYMKVSNEAFFSFVDDIIRYTEKINNTTPFILLGRTHIIDLVYRYLDNKNVASLKLKIDPFTEQQAKDFLHLYVIGQEKSKYDTAYKETVEYLIGSIQGFFKSQGRIDQATYENFIGYAPVLLAIVELLRDQTPGTLLKEESDDSHKRQQNYQAILSQLKKEGTKNVNLLIGLIEAILVREQKKIQDNLIRHLVEKFDEDVAKKAEGCYSPSEQCFRLLTYCLGFEEPFCVVDDEAFKVEYEKGLESFFKEHPFLIDDKLGNVVFETYVLANMALNVDFAYLVEEYVENDFKPSFALYPIMAAYIDRYDSPLPQALFAPIYSSLTSQSPEMLQTDLEIIQSDADSVSVTFQNEQTKIDDEIAFKLEDDKKFRIGELLGNTSVNGEFDVILSERHIHIMAPVSVNCRKFAVKSNDIVITNPTNSDSTKQMETEVTIVCDKFILNPQNGSVAALRIDSGIEPAIYTSLKPGHPFSKFHKNEPYKKEDPHYDKFQKLRGIIQQFRAHKKGGDWAKKKDKIYRRYAYGIGKKTLEALLSNGILYEDKHLYKLDPDKFKSILNLSYEDMLNGDINSSVNKFLESY